MKNLSLIKTTLTFGFLISSLPFCWSQTQSTRVKHYREVVEKCNERYPSLDETELDFCLTDANELKINQITNEYFNDRPAMSNSSNLATIQYNELFPVTYNFKGIKEVLVLEIDKDLYSRDSSNCYQINVTFEEKKIYTLKYCKPSYSPLEMTLEYFRVN